MKASRTASKRSTIQPATTVRTLTAVFVNRLETRHESLSGLVSPVLSRQGQEDHCLEVLGEFWLENSRIPLGRSL